MSDQSQVWIAHWPAVGLLSYDYLAVTMSADTTFCQRYSMNLAKTMFSVGQVFSNMSDNNS